MNGVLLAKIIKKDLLRLRYGEHPPRLLRNLEQLR